MYKLTGGMYVNFNINPLNYHGYKALLNSKMVPLYEQNLFMDGSIKYVVYTYLSFVIACMLFVILHLKKNMCATLSSVH